MVAQSDRDTTRQPGGAAAARGGAAALAAPSAQLAATLMAREHWQVLEPVLLILVEAGHLTFPTAVSWLADPNDALDGLSPAQWVADSRDIERLLRVAQHDAERLGQ